MGDYVQIFIQDGKSKRGSWTSPRQVLSIDSEAGSIVVPGRAGKQICAAFEDVRAARSENELAMSIQESIDQLDFNLVDILSPIEIGEHDEIHHSENHHIESENSESEPPGDFTCANSKNTHNSSVSDSPNDDLPATGDRISVYWPLENQYFPGTVNSIESNGFRVIQYDDCLLYTSPSPRDQRGSRMPSSA